MGWLDFFASIIGSLAWPGVLLVVLWYNRARLSNLPDWIEELTLPGGTKVKFTRALDKATGLILASEAPGAVPSASGVAEQSPEAIVVQFPEVTVVQSFIELVETLGDMVRFLALPTKRREPEMVMEELARLGYIDQTSVELFRSLKDAYAAAVRAGYGRLAPEEGVRYRQAAQVLNARLREVLPRLEVDNPRRKAWGTPS
jgi:hypothetical protein